MKKQQQRSNYNSNKNYAFNSLCPPLYLFLSFPLLFSLSSSWSLSLYFNQSTIFNEIMSLEETTYIQNERTNEETKSLKSSVVIREWNE